MPPGQASPVPNVCSISHPWPGLSRTSARALLRPVTFQQRTLPTVIAAINEARVARFVLMSSFGIADTRSKTSFLPRVVYGAVARNLFEDKALAETALLTVHDKRNAHSVSVHAADGGRPEGSPALGSPPPCAADCWRRRSDALARSAASERRRCTRIAARAASASPRTIAR